MEEVAQKAAEVIPPDILPTFPPTFPEHLAFPENASCFDFTRSQDFLERELFPRFSREWAEHMLHRKMKKRTPLPDSVAGLSPLELARRIPVGEAADHNHVHVQTFLKHYRHLVRRIGARRLFVTVHDAIVLPPPDTS